MKLKNGASRDFIRPWPCIRYKARGGLIPDTRPWPYNRGNTVLEKKIVTTRDIMCLHLLEIMLLTLNWMGFWRLALCG